MSGIVTVYALFPDAGEAERIGRAMVESRRAACVNILGPCRSIYRWEDKVEEANEVPALFKTTTAQAEALMAEIRARHSYAVPAIVVWPIQASLPAYGDWVQRQVS